jgi:hypothetical protein
LGSACQHARIAGRTLPNAELDPFGSMGTLRFNHLHPPFNNVKMRQAVLAVADQVDFLVAYAGDPAKLESVPFIFHLQNANGERRWVGSADW